MTAIHVPSLRSQLRVALRHGLWVLGALSLADAATTWVALRLGATEANPLAVPIAHSPLPFVVKAVLVVGAILQARRVPVRRAVQWVWFFNGLYTLVVFANLSVITRLVVG